VAQSKKRMGVLTRSRRGASLVGVMVMAGAGVVVGASLLSMNLNIARLQKQIETRGELSTWKSLAGQYLAREDSGLCTAFIGATLPPEAEFCQKLLTSAGDQACSDLEVALKPNTRESCSLDPQAKEEDRCPELFQPRGYPAIAQLPAPSGYAGQSMRLVLSRIARGPGHSASNPEYILPLQLVMAGSKPGNLQVVEPGMVTLRLNDKRVVESCSLGAAAAESPDVEAFCEQLGLRFDAESGKCGIFVAPKDCSTSGGVAGISATGEVICGTPDGVTLVTSSTGSTSGCRGWINARCWYLDPSVDAGRGWRFNSNKNYLENYHYCKKRTESCQIMGGVVSDVDAQDTVTAFEYCSKRDRRGRCTTWVDQRKRSNHHSCICK
jgi:hypothetical protein